MGDRGNVVVRHKPADVWLYSHWGGTDLAVDVQRVLNKRWRWQDAPYLTRVIFDEMTKGRQGNETGYGISTGPCDNEHNITVVDCERQVVTINEAEHTSPGYAIGKVIWKWYFEQFIDFPTDELNAIYNGVEQQS